jgi:hypothetical protein
MSSSSNINRRALVAGAAITTAALPVASIPAAALADPIYAAIEAHKAKNAVFRAACAQVYDGPPCRDEEEAGVHAALDAESAAARAMFLTVPTTLAGIAALVDYVVGQETAGTEMLNLIMDPDVLNEEGAAALLQTLNVALARLV